MLKEGVDFLHYVQATRSSGGFYQHWFPETETTPVIDYLLQDEKVRTNAAAFLVAANPGLPLEEKRGLVLFSALVVKADDVLDSPNFISAQNESLERALLFSSFPLGNRVMSLKNLEQLTLSNFPFRKQLLIQDFLNNMRLLHMTQSHRHMPGTYGFMDSVPYKAATNGQFLATGLSLGESSVPVENLVEGAIAVQMIDDYYDWQEDSLGCVDNLLIGMASDVWNAKGRPVLEDLDYLQSLSQTGVRSPKVLSNPRFRDTRKAYLGAFNSYMQQAEGFPFRNVMKVYGNVQFRV